MKTHFSDAAHDVLDHATYPTVSVLGRFSDARFHYDMTALSPHLSLVKWRRAEIAESRCVTCTAIRCQIQKGWQS